jgi:hypothetical protein
MENTRCVHCGAGLGNVGDTPLRCRGCLKERVTAATTPTSSPTPPTTDRGWLCPRCMVINAPWCECCRCTDKDQVPYITAT